jgi:hypothetical protein
MNASHRPSHYRFQILGSRNKTNLNTKRKEVRHSKNSTTSVSDFKTFTFFPSFDDTTHRNTFINDRFYSHFYSSLKTASAEADGTF